MSSISKFSSNMSKGFARPNLFKVEISKVQTSQQEKYQMSCFQAQIPGHNIATTDKDIGFRSIAYQKIFSDVILGFYVDADLNQLDFWQNWIDQIVDKNTNWHNYYNKYVGDNIFFSDVDRSKFNSYKVAIKSKVSVVISILDAVISRWAEAIDKSVPSNLIYSVESPTWNCAVPA